MWPCKYCTGQPSDLGGGLSQKLVGGAVYRKMAELRTIKLRLFDVFEYGKWQDELRFKSVSYHALGVQSVLLNKVQEKRGKIQRFRKEHCAIG